jgi:acylphosphatase
MLMATRVIIRGRVQGVWFRGWTVEAATRRALDGWVRNRADGSVEAVFAGPEAMVREMIELCGNGPPAAHVISVETVPFDGAVMPGFRQLPTL